MEAPLTGTACWFFTFAPTYLCCELPVSLFWPYMSLLGYHVKPFSLISDSASLSSALHLSHAPFPLDFNPISHTSLTKPDVLCHQESTTLNLSQPPGLLQPLQLVSPFPALPVGFGSPIQSLTPHTHLQASESCTPVVISSCNTGQSERPIKDRLLTSAVLIPAHSNVSPASSLTTCPKGEGHYDYGIELKLHLIFLYLTT